MRAVARITLLVLGGGLSAVPLRAQGSWVPPQPPCELPPPPSKVKDGMQALRGAVEKPELREQQLGQARKLLTEAIAQDNQGANAGAWYYLGRYYVETGDVPGADSALTRAAGLAPKCGDDIATYRNELWGKLLNAGPVAFLGRLSFSLYLWQQFFLNPYREHWTCRWPVNLGFVFAAALFSYWLIEKPFLRLKQRFRA